MTRCLVIGASGFLGSRILDLGPGFEVAGTVRARDKHGFLTLDLLRREEIDRCLAEVNPDVVIYAAGMTSVDDCEINPAAASCLNAEVPEHIAKAHWGRCVFISTDYVFDGAKGNYSETDVPEPINHYGVSKAAGERAVLDANKNSVVLRVSGLFDQNGMKGEVFGGPAGELRVLSRDDNRVSSPVHVEDVKQALRIILRTDCGGIFHAGGPDALSRYEFRQIVALHRGDMRSIEATLYARPETGALRPLDTSLTTQRLKGLGWRPSSVAETLAHCDGTDASEKTPAWLPAGVEGVLVDCVGALLGPRNWLQEHVAVEELDARCAAMKDSASLFGEARALGVHLTARNLEELITRRYAPNPEIWGFLPSLARRHRLALVNNGPSLTFRAWVRKYGLDRIFKVIANSEELGIRKPQPEFYEYVARQLEAPAERCFLLDDDPENVKGAMRYGMLAARTVANPAPAVTSFVPADPPVFEKGDPL